MANNSSLSWTTRGGADVEDIITSPPQQEPYTKLRTELMYQLSPSTEQRVHQLLTFKKLGDSKPSQFLRHLRSLAQTISCTESESAGYPANIQAIPPASLTLSWMPGRWLSGITPPPPVLQGPSLQPRDRPSSPWGNQRGFNHTWMFLWALKRGGFVVSSGCVAVMKNTETLAVWISWRTQILAAWLRWRTQRLWLRGCDEEHRDSSCVAAMKNAETGCVAVMNTETLAAWLWWRTQRLWLHGCNEERRDSGCMAVMKKQRLAVWLWRRTQILAAWLALWDSPCSVVGLVWVL
jgi:hypothetical protein